MLVKATIVMNLYHNIWEKTSMRKIQVLMKHALIPVQSCLVHYSVTSTMLTSTSPTTSPPPYCTRPSTSPPPSSPPNSLSNSHQRKRKSKNLSTCYTCPLKENLTDVPHIPVISPSQTPANQTPGPPPHLSLSYLSLETGAGAFLKTSAAVNSIS